MKHGSHTSFKPGKPFKFFGQLTKEEAVKEKSGTRECIECGRRKFKSLFARNSEVCLRCSRKY